MQLLKALDKALHVLCGNHLDRAVRWLNKFISKVNQLLKLGLINQTTADTLIADAQVIIAKILGL